MTFPLATYTTIKTPFHIHALSTPGDLATFLKTLALPLAIGLCLALHEVVIVGLAPGTDEVGGTKERGRGCAYLFDFGDVFGEWCSVVEHLAGETRARVLASILRHWRE